MTAIAVEEVADRRRAQEVAIAATWVQACEAEVATAKRQLAQAQLALSQARRTVR